MEHTHSTSDRQRENQKESAIIKEMMPYLVYALIPLIITITIAMVFAPKMTLP